MPSTGLDKQEIYEELMQKQTFPCSGVQTSLIKWLRGYQANVLHRFSALIFDQILSFCFNCGL